MDGHPRRVAAFLAGALLAVSVVAGCTDSEPSSTGASSSAVPVVLPRTDSKLTDADRSACATLIAALPERLAGQQRDVDAGVDPDAGGVAWGDPAIRLRCGVGVPAGFDPTAVPGEDDPAPCAKVSGVGWYVPPDQLDGDGDAVLTAVTFTPRVAVLVPQTYLPEGSAAALAELAAPIRHALQRSLRCG